MSKVTLTLEKNQYYPGNIIRGCALCYLKRGKDFRVVTVKLKGEESTQWTGRETYYNRGENKPRHRDANYHGKHDLISINKIVRKEGRINAGKHGYVFEFSLPEYLPSTYQHSYGRIYFSVKVTLTRASIILFQDEKEVIILSPIKLERFSPSFQHPAHYSADEKTTCFFCCTNGHIQLVATLEKKAFVVGGHAGINVYCRNMSNSNVESLNVEITAHIRFKANHPSNDYKYHSEILASSQNSGVGAHGDKTYNLKIEIPSSAVLPNFTGCDLFSYATPLKITAVISESQTNLEIITDVAIGHVPYPDAPPLSAQYVQTVPPSPTQRPMIDYSEPVSGQSSNDFQPLLMPSPMVPPSPVSDYPAGPSAPSKSEAPSVLPKLDVYGNSLNMDAGNSNSQANESPLPSYDEAATFESLRGLFDEFSA